MLNYVQRAPDDRASLLGMPGWFSSLLRARGVDSDEKAFRFLHPSPENLYDPFLLDGMETAVCIIQDAVSRKQRIMVYGDYDVDGICATAILLETLIEEGADADFRIPSRHTEGYGLNEQAVREIADGFQLLITVDCGITSMKEVALARQLGMRVIVTDHHEPPDILPDADAVLDPLLGHYPFRHLCGAGVALKICQALQGMPGVEKRLELAALATVADVVPLTDENRIIVREGLDRMASTARPGLRALLETSSVTPPVRSGHLAFRLGPRLNAAGRLEDASQGVTLLLTRDSAQAHALTQHLEENNRLRQQMEQEILRQAFLQITPESFRDNRVLILQGTDWNSGLIGLAAGKICERYHFPAIVLSVQDENAIGSCRSIPGINIYQALSRCSDLFLRFGGHEQAAGLTLPAALIPELRRRLNSIIRETCDDRLFLPSEAYDLSLPFRDLSLKTVDYLEALEPTGFGNPAPVFLVSGAEVQEMRRVGQDRSHLKLSLLDEETVLSGIAFSRGDAADRGYRKVDALYVPSRNEFRGNISLQLQVKALRPSSACLPLPEENRLFLSLLQEISLFPAKETGYPVPPLLTEAAGAEHLRAPLGTLLLTRDWQRAERLARETEADLFVRPDSDPRCFSSVLTDWQPGDLHNQWQIILLGEGELLPEEARLVQDRCPDAALFRLPANPGMKQLLASLCLTDEQLRELYRLLLHHLKKESAAAQTDTLLCGFSSPEELAEAAFLSVPQVLTGLQAFTETHLAEWTLHPFSIRIPRVRRKCSMSDSPLIRYLRRNFSRDGS